MKRLSEIFLACAVLIGAAHAQTTLDLSSARAHGVLPTTKGGTGTNAADLAALKTYLGIGAAGAATWGHIGGTISEQDDLVGLLGGKAPLDGTGASGTWGIGVTGNAGGLAKGTGTLDWTEGTSTWSFGAGNVSAGAFSGSGAGLTGILPTALTGAGTVPVAALPAVAPYAHVYNVRLYGATGDGTTDDTAAFEAAEAALPATGGTIYVPEGTYIVSYRIRKPYVTLRGGNWNCILKTPPGATTLNNDCPVRVLKDYCTVENLQIDGNKANNAAIDDFDLGRKADGVGIFASNVTVRNCYIHDTIGHKVIVWNEEFADSGGSTAIRGARYGALITQNLCSGVGQRAAIDVATGDNYQCIVSFNRVRDMPIIFHTATDSSIIGNEIQIAAKDQPGISVHTGSTRCSIIGNIVRGADVGISTTGDDSAVHDILIADNKVYDSTTGILARAFDRVRISNNLVDTASSQGISVTSGTDFEVNGNTVSNTVTYGINLGTALIRYGRVSDNHVTTTVQGIYAVSVQDASIADNVLHTCDYGVNQTNAAGARLAITGNRLVAITYPAIVCTAASSSISGNDIEGASDGIRLAANNLFVTGNRIGSATGIGIRVMSTYTGLVIRGNRIASTGAAVGSPQADTVVADNTGYIETSARQISVGTTAQRPTAAAGLIRYNSTTGTPEWSNASAWVSLLNVIPTVAAPAAQTSAGTIGEIRVDTSHIFVCTVSGADGAAHWKRVALDDTAW